MAGNIIPNAVDENGNYYLSESVFLPGRGDRNSKIPTLKDGRIEPSYLPRTIETDTKAQMTALTGVYEGDFCIVSKDAAPNNGTYQYVKSGDTCVWKSFGGSGSVSAAAVTYAGTETSILDAATGKISFIVSNAVSNGLKLVYTAATKTLSATMGQATAAAFGAVKLTDTVAADSTASTGVGVTGKAVADYVSDQIAGIVRKVTINGVAKTTDASGNISLSIVKGTGIDVTTDASGNITIAPNVAEMKAALGLGSAAYKNAGTGAGQIPLLDATGKLPDSVISSLFSTEIIPCKDATVTTIALLVAWVKKQVLQRGDMVIVGNGVQAVVGKYVLGANVDVLTEDTLYDFGSPDEMAIIVNGLAYTARNGVITVSADLVSNISVSGTGASALVVRKNINTTTGECTVDLEVKTASSSQYGVIKVSDNYSGANSDIAASLKAVNDALGTAKKYGDDKLGTTAITAWGATITAAIAAIGAGQVTTISKSSDSSAGFAISKSGNAVTVTLKNASATVPGLVQMAAGAATSTVYDTQQTDTRINNAVSGKASTGTYVCSKLTFTSANVNDSGIYVINRVVPILAVILSDGSRVFPVLNYGASSMTLQFWSDGSTRGSVYGGLFSAANAAKVHTVFIGEVVL